MKIQEMIMHLNIGSDLDLDLDHLIHDLLSYLLRARMRDLLEREYG